MKATITREGWSVRWDAGHIVQGGWNVGGIRVDMVLTASTQGDIGHASQLQQLATWAVAHSDQGCPVRLSVRVSEALLPPERPGRNVSALCRAALLLALDRPGDVGELLTMGPRRLVHIRCSYGLAGRAEAAVASGESVSDLIHRGLRYARSLPLLGSFDV